MHTPLILLAACVVASQSGPAPITLPVIADANLSSYPSERPYNYGASSRMRLKGIEMFGLFKFDLEPVRGLEVLGAALRFRPTQDSHLLRTLGIYTVAEDWVEGASAGAEGPGATFLSPDAPRRLWGPGPDFLAVSFTHGNTLVEYADTRPVGDGWLEVDVSPRVVHAMCLSASYGLLLTDEKGQTRANNDIYTREQSGAAPYMIVKAAPAAIPAPEPIRDMRVRPAPEFATYDRGAAMAEWTAPARAFCYRVFVDGVEVPRWLVPWPSESGTTESVVVDWVAPGTSLTVTLVALNELGASTEATTTGAASAARPRPIPLSLGPRLGPKAEATEAEPIGLAWYDGIVKVHPVTGLVLEEAGIETYGAPAAAQRQSGDSELVLQAGRNEFVSAVLVIAPERLPASGLAVQASPLVGPGGAVPPPDLYRLWYVRDREWMPEVCVPITGPLDIPASDNDVPGQTNQAVLLDLYVPHAARPGEYTGTVTVTLGDARVDTPVTLEVLDVVLPDRLNFVAELNSYGSVADQYGLEPTSPEYVAIEHAYHRLAHAHRANWNPLPYSHASTLVPGTTPPLVGTGADCRVADWSAWDARYGPLLDGSAFRDLPRSGMPVHSMYLPFCEGWPAPMSLYTAAVPTREYPQLIIDHAMMAPPIEQAFAPPYVEQFRAVLREYRRHFEERGWEKTWFHFYMNNKYYYKDPAQGGRGTSWWLLDEPMHRDDWLALRFYADMFAAEAAGSTAAFVSRGDISRPQWQPAWMDRAFQLMCISGELYEHHRLCMELAGRQALTLWNYGACNSVGRTNLETVAWAWQAFLAGADGILPWNTIASDRNYTEPEDTAVLYPGLRFGIRGPLASLRLKAMRRGAQDAEYLRMLAERRGYDRRDLREVLAPHLPLTSRVVERYAEDAGQLEFAALEPARFAVVRDAVRTALAAQ